MNKNISKMEKNNRSFMESLTSSSGINSGFCKNTTTNENIRVMLNVVYEYIDSLNNSELFSKLENFDFLLFVGFRMILHIFQLNYVHSKNIHDVYYNCQKAYYFYLEYLEQMYSTNMCQELNHLDAILFVYSKTLFIYEKDSINNQDSNKENTINCVINDVFQNDIFIKNMAKITKLLNTIFWWENKHIQPILLPKHLLSKILELHFINNHEEIFEYIEEKQQNMLSHDEYIKLLENIS